MGPINAESNSDLAWMGWSVQDVANWVDTLLGSPHSARFVEKKIDGPTLLELSEEDLRVELGLEDAIHRKKLLGHIRLFRTHRARFEQKPGGGAEAHAAPASRVSSGAPRNRLLPDGTTDEYLDVEDGINASIHATLGMWPGTSKTNSRSDLAPTPPVPGMRGIRGSATPPGPPPPKTLSKTASAATSISMASAGSLSQDGYSSGYPSRHSMGSSRGGQGQRPTSRTSPRGNPGAPTMSPSRGVSFTTAAKKPVQRFTDRCEPGPATYHVQSPRISDRARFATIGNSPRNTSEFLISPSAEFGSNWESGAGLTSRARGRVKGGVIGTATRFSRTSFSPR